MSDNYFVSDAFQNDAEKAVGEAIAQADALGLPKAYDPAMPAAAPEKTEVVGLTTKKKALAKALQAA